MKKKLSMRLICLLLAGSILTGAIAVSAVNGSPYEVFKNAFFDSLFFENYTLRSESFTRVNGEKIHHSLIFATQDSRSRSNIQYDIVNGRRWVHFSSDLLDVRTNVFSSRDGQIYRAYISDGFVPETFIGGDDDGVFVPRSRDSNQMRLIELALDLMVGDMRNHMSMTTDSDGTRHISGEIIGNQLPEIVRLLFSMMADDEYTVATRRYGNTAPMQRFEIDRMYGQARINPGGYLIYLRGGAQAMMANRHGEERVVEFELFLTFRELGTTVVESPIPYAEQIFTPQFMYETFGCEDASARFTLYADGTVNLNSIMRNDWVQSW